MGGVAWVIGVLSFYKSSGHRASLVFVLLLQHLIKEMRADPNY